MDPGSACPSFPLSLLWEGGVARGRSSHGAVVVEGEAAEDDEEQEEQEVEADAEEAEAEEALDEKKRKRKRCHLCHHDKHHKTSSLCCFCRKTAARRMRHLGLPHPGRKDSFKAGGRGRDNRKQGGTPSNLTRGPAEGPCGPHNARSAKGKSCLV
ncbi:hypothetical protein CRENBAI_015652 [Crenichthys baileyi]|uniref:Uncharacterized protein n=1 Tax=Crenichthys baileyi TaxID=28760 RepID=A0AAV9SJY7_9TELE